VGTPAPISVEAAAVKTPALFRSLLAGDAARLSRFSPISPKPVQLGEKAPRTQKRRQILAVNARE
jgi:hypothetical protein